MSIDSEQFVGDQEYFYEHDNIISLIKASIAWIILVFLITLIH